MSSQDDRWPGHLRAKATAGAPAAATPSPSVMAFKSAANDRNGKADDHAPYAAAASASSRTSRRARYRRTGSSTPFSERAPAGDQR